MSSAARPSPVFANAIVLAGVVLIAIAAAETIAAFVFGG